MKTDHKDTDLEIYPHWGSGPKDRSIETTIAKVIGIICISLLPLAILLVIFDIFILK